MTAEPRVFTGSTMREALARVKRELGPDAVILGTRHVSSSRVGEWMGRAKVEITAAAGRPATLPPRGAANRVPAEPEPDRGRNGAGNYAGASGSQSPRRRDRETATRDPGTEDTGSSSRVHGRNSSASIAAPALPASVFPFYQELVKNEVVGELAERLARHIAADVRSATDRDVATARLRDAISRIVPVCDGISLVPGQRRVVALVGPPGGGKTSTLAKLAAHYKLRRSARVGILSLDMHRLATHEQLRRFGALLGVPMKSAQTVSRLKQAQKSLADVDLLLIDTPGLGFRDRGRFVRLAALLRAAHADELHLVLPACLIPTVQDRYARAFAPLGASRLVLTHLDEAVGMGVMLGAVERLGLALSFFCGGQNVPKDINCACSDLLATLVFSRRGALEKLPDGSGNAHTNGLVPAARFEQVS
ncbi:MAG: hypothetical protein U1D55_19185 [Phycisphaerae bacterium]